MGSMDPQVWNQVEEAFNAALDAADDDVAAALDAHCPNDTARALVLDLLAAHHQAPDFLERVTPSAVGDRIGQYALVERLGEGGMGVVFRATRADGHYRQQVAIKVLNAGMESRELKSRLRSERQILASLDHSHITRLLDGGVDDSNRPYLVMELVEDAVPIDLHCARAGLKHQARLELFLEVCHAVAHAHSRQVIHRDLKPSNILIGKNGLRLLDFGIAKVIDRVHVDLTLMQTATGEGPLTLSCAAPEQVLGESVTTATDVYALGVLLYLLLAGQPPYTLARAPLSRVMQLICEEDPPPPSKAGCPHLRGDLDAIVMKALQKAPAERYSTVQALADDIERHLASESVWARRRTPTLWVRHLVRRHLTATLIALAAAAMASAWVLSQAISIAQPRDAVYSIMRSIGPLGAPSRALEDAEPTVLGMVRGMPVLEVRVLQALHVLWSRLGRPDRGLERIEQAVALHRQTGTDDLWLAQMLISLSMARSHFTDHDRALEAARESYGLTVASLGSEDWRTRAAAVVVAAALTRSDRATLAEAEEILTGVLAGAERADLRATAAFHLASVHRMAGRYSAAVAGFAQVEGASEELWGTGSVTHARVVGALCATLGDAGRPGPRQLETCEQSLRFAEANYPAHAGHSVEPLGHLGIALLAAGRLDEAVIALEQALANQRARPQTWPPVAIDVQLANLGVVNLSRGEVGLAEQRLREALQIRTVALGGGHVGTATIAMRLAEVLLATGRAAEGLEICLPASALRRARLGIHPDVVGDLTVHGQLLVALGDPAAEATLRAAVAMADEVVPLDHPDHASPRLALALVTERIEATALAERALAVREQALPADHYLILEARAWLEHYRGQPPEALQELRAQLGFDHHLVKAIQMP